VPTGTDGVFSLEVPKGSPLYLHTDDFDTSNDNWIPLINIDSPVVVANSDMLDFPIHCCPQTTCKSPADSLFDGSVAIWDNYLQNGDQNNGDMFVPTSPNNSGGTIVMLMGDCPNSDSVSVTTSAPEFPVGYMLADKTFPSDDGSLSCGYGPDYFYPSTRTTSDPSGFAVSFGDPAFAGQTVTVTITDALSQPFRNFSSPVEVPVRPGTLSLVWPLTVNGQPATFKEWGCECLSIIFCTP